MGADGSLPWAPTRCPVAERAAYEESVWLPHQLLLGPERDVDDIVTAIEKIQRHAGELVSAEHPLVRINGTNRAERDRVAAARA